MNKKEQILDLYFNKHLKQTEIAEKVNVSQQYISKIIKKDERYENEKSSRKSINAEKRKIAQGKIIRLDYVTQHFSILLENIGLKHIRFHDLRHSCASLLLAKGIPMKSIQEWLGHSNFSTTANLYAHLDSNSKKKSAEVLYNALKFTDTKKENEESASSSSQK